MTGCLPMISKLIEFLVKGYALLLAVAVGGFLGANVAGLVAGVSRSFLDPDGRPVRAEDILAWSHWGWLIGAGLALVGGILQARRSGLRKEDEELRRPRRWARLRSYPSPRGVLVSAALGGVGLGLLGAMLGGTFLMLWFSLAYSPFAPAWRSAVTVERDRTMARRRGEPRSQYFHETRHPVALYAFWGPAILGAAAGVLLGGGAALRNSRRKPEG